MSRAAILTGTDNIGDAEKANGGASVSPSEMSGGDSARIETGEVPRERTWPRFFAALCVFAATALVLHARNSREVIPPSTPLSAFPAVIGDWTGQDIALSQEQLAVLGPGDFLMRDYRESADVMSGSAHGERGPDDGAVPVSAAHVSALPVNGVQVSGTREEKPGDAQANAAEASLPAVNLYLAYYPSQRTGDTIHSPQNCLPGAGWTPLTSSRVPLERPGGGVMTVNRYVVAQGEDRMLVYYWYQAHGRVTASEYWAKIFLVTDAMRMNRTDGALVRVMAPFDAASGETAAQAEAMAFTKKVLPLLDAYIPR